MRKSEVILTLALLGSAAMSWWLWSALTVERARNAELGARAASLPTPITAPEATVSALVAAPASPTAATTAANFAVTTSAHVEHNAEEDAVESQRRKLQQPKYREAWRAQLRLNYARRRENVVRLFGFTPEEADAVVEIAIDRQLAWIDRSQQEPVTQEVIEQAQREDQAKFRELLGEEKATRFQEYMESRNTRVQIDQLRPQFTGTDALRDDQVEPLIAALHVENTRLRTEQQEYRTSVTSSDPQPGQQGNERELELLEAAHARMHTAAAPVLSDSQLKRFDALLKRDLERQQLEARMSSGAPDAVSNTH